MGVRLVLRELTPFILFDLNSFFNVTFRGGRTGSNANVVKLRYQVSGNRLIRE